MKKSLLVIILLLIVNLLIGCNLGCKYPYNLKTGAYSFEKAVITNRFTKEVTEKSFDDILNDKDEFQEWGNLFSFQIRINNETEYFKKKDGRCFVLNEGLAFEIVGENTLSLHFPYWCSYDFYSYDVVIILCWEQLYG